MRSRRGRAVAIIAVARKLAVMFWDLLTSGEDYAYGRPSLTQHKLRQIELLAGGASQQRGRTGASRNPELRDRERELTAQPSMPTGAWSPTGSRPSRRERGRRTGARILRLS